MLLLASVTDKLQVVTAQAVNVDVHASFMDYNGTTVTPGRTNTKISTATTTDVVASPGASTTRNCKTLHISNIHASSAVTVTLNHTDGTNVVQIEQVTLLAGERLGYVEGVGCRIFDVNGMEKTNGAAAVTAKTLLADLTNATTTAAKVTGLDFACGIGTWIFEYFVLWRSDTTTTGLKLGCNHSGTVTSFVYDMYGATADITTNTSVMDQDVLLTTGATMSAWAARAKSVTAPMIAAGVDTINVDMLMMISGLVVVTVAGNMELYHASEAATTTTVKANSCLRLTRVA